MVSDDELDAVLHDMAISEAWSVAGRQKRRDVLRRFVLKQREAERTLCVELERIAGEELAARNTLAEVLGVEPCPEGAACHANDVAKLVTKLQGENTELSEKCRHAYKLLESVVDG